MSTDTTGQTVVSAFAWKREYCLSSINQSINQSIK